MSSRRRVGVSAATTEAARRQLMQPVACWEKVWVTPENPAVNSKMKVFKWVKTDKIQQFNDEDEVDEPLAPLPDADEVEVIDADEEEEKEVVTVEPTPAPDTVLPETQEVEVEEPKVEEEPTTQLTLQDTEADLAMHDGTAGLGDADMLDPSVVASLEAADVTMDVDPDALKMPDDDAGLDIDMSAFGPDGLSLEGNHDMSQIEPGDDIMGGPLMDETIDPFAGVNPIDPDPQ